MGLLRSETMSFGTLTLPPNEREARRIIGIVGRELHLQFEDQNAKSMRRPYVKTVQRIAEMERILRFLFNEIQAIDGCTVTKQKIKEFMDSDRIPESALKMEEVEKELWGLSTQFNSMKDGNSQLLAELCQATEEYHVVQRASELGGTDGHFSTGNDLKEPLQSASLGTVAGVVAQADEVKLRLALFRASRGNAFADIHQIQDVVQDPKTGAFVKKSVFVVYFQGAGGAALHAKVVKVCHAIGVNLYPWSKDNQTPTNRLNQLKVVRQEKQKALEGFTSFMKGEMDRLTAPRKTGGNSLIEDWRLFCVKEKSIYTILNMCSGEAVLHVGVWYPAEAEQNIKDLLQKNSSPDQHAATLFREAAPRGLPPTFIRTNEYTEGWQGVIDTYGIPSYKEVNPGLITVVTFPFIFGMMYGDVGHGSMLLCVGIWLVANAENHRYSAPGLFTARYMILSLGIFATFAGFMYNDFFSVGLEIFDSGFKMKDLSGEHEATFDTTNGCDAAKADLGGPYPFGLDHAWCGASNELLFVNSMKMKLSVLFGVLQMILGVCFRFCNALWQHKQKNWTDFFFECIPMMTFMVCFFGWMDFMILYKWAYPVDPPPSIINSLICMAMWTDDKHGKEDNDFFKGSVDLSKKLMFASILAVPIMLFPKPFILLAEHNAKEQENKGEAQTHLALEEGGGHGGHGDHEEFEFGEIFIHQVIETIEFVLGSVSHTASYLRIWALSLAHQQLSLVFFQKTLSMGLNIAKTGDDGSIYLAAVMLYFMYAAWFGVTIAVLLGMDVLECFLHTLRLHWVEFQSKFYQAKGYAFTPYSIKKLIMESED